MQTTVHEALTYSAFLRLPEAVSRQVKEEFVEEIMNVVELTPLRNSIVGLPGELQMRRNYSEQHFLSPCVKIKGAGASA